MESFRKKLSDYLVTSTTLPFQIFYSSISVLGLQQQTNIQNKSQYFQRRRYLEKLENKLWGRKLQWLCIKVKVLKHYSKCLTFFEGLLQAILSNLKSQLSLFNIFGGFQRAMFLTLFYRCSSYKPQIDMRGRKQFHKGKSIHKDSYNTKQHTQSKEELASALMPLENPIFQLFGDTPCFSSIQSKSKTARSINNNYRKGQQSKMVLNSGEVFHMRNQVICKLSYRQLSQEVTSLFLTSFNFVSYLSLINIFGGF